MPDTWSSITVVWPAHLPHVITFNGNWRKLENNTVEATYTRREFGAALRWMQQWTDLPILSLDEPWSAPRERPDHPCHTCGADNWWERPAKTGGGWLCGRCHPNPVDLIRLQSH